MKVLLLPALLFATLTLSAQKTEVLFDIYFKGDKIGSLKGTEDKVGNQVVKDIKTQSDTRVFPLRFTWSRTCIRFTKTAI